MNSDEKMMMAYGLVEGISMMLPERFTSAEIELPAKQILRAIQIKLMISDDQMRKIVENLNTDSHLVYRMVIDTYKEKTHEIYEQFRTNTKDFSTESQSGNLEGEK